MPLKVSSCAPKGKGLSHAVLPSNRLYHLDLIMFSSSLAQSEQPQRLSRCDVCRALHGVRLLLGGTLVSNRNNQPHKNGSIAALTTIGVALAASGYIIGYLLLAVIVGYLMAQ